MLTARLMTDVPEKIQVIHPFHPLRNCKLKVVGTWSTHNTNYVQVLDKDGNKIRIPIAWTDAPGARNAVDKVLDTKTWFRCRDLLKMSNILSTLLTAKKCDEILDS